MLKIAMDGKKENTTMMLYDQGAREWSRPYCRFFSHITVASNLTGIQVTEADLESFRESRGSRKSTGGGIRSGDVSTRWNTRFPIKIKHIELVLFSKRWYAYLDKGTGVVVDISVTEQFLADYRDGVIDTVKFKGAKGGGHIVSIHKIGDDYCFTNTWRTHNIVKIPKENMESLDIWKSRESFTYQIVK